jgi:hypothetical protein
MTKRKTSPSAGTSVKVPARAYATLRRLAMSEQRTITTTIERAVEHYRAATEGSQS